MTLVEKQATLQARLRQLSPMAIAYSGGVDSTLLLCVATAWLGPDNVLGIIGDSPSLPRRELAAAQALAASFGARIASVAPQELRDPQYAANPPDRCYHCKRALFAYITELARQRGILHVADGNNADDAGDWRPGRRAAAELGVHSPLLEAGLTKAEIREWSSQLGLATATKPAMACLASRLPYGTPITATVLSQVEQAEQILQDLGFRQLRVRHHGDLARIEVAAAEIPRLATPPVRGQILQQLQALGYRHVAVDLAGYQMGSLNPPAGTSLTKSPNHSMLTPEPAAEPWSGRGDSP